jgi:glutamate N-acetyltransferase / amino-acid N-acetyltransferase
VASTQLSFSSRDQHRAWLASQSALPRGFRVGTAAFEFVPAEAPKPSRMTLTVIALERPTPDFAAVFTSNAVVGAPVTIGRQRLDEPAVGAVVVNNKVSNVGAPDGVAAAERVCAAVADGLGFRAGEVLPNSTGVIGWRLPLEPMLAAVPRAVRALSAASVMPAAEGIMTTDLYPKVRRAQVGGGSIVGIAKGAGMIEPNCATMLVYLLTDLAVPRAELRRLLPAIVDRSFNRISIDGDMSTSDTVALLASGAAGPADPGAFAAALETVCADLAEDLVRNGEGVHHVLRVRVAGAPSEAIARLVGKSVANSPLVKTAICGNDANVGRLLMAIGKPGAQLGGSLDLGKLRVSIAGQDVFAAGAFRLSGEKESALTTRLREAELYPSKPGPDGVFRPPVDYPPHERVVDIDVDLGAGAASCQVLGADLSHEYVSENADYRS